MSFQPVLQVIHTLQDQANWHQYRQFHQLLVIWDETVGQVVATQTRPLWINRQQILKVATSSSAWAQNLTFERHRILTKLNHDLDTPLSDVHFSSRQWQKNAPDFGEEPLPIRKAHVDTPTEPPAPLNWETAFQQWSAQIQHQSQHLPLCPHCHCPTPAPELERWSVCALCAARR
jgi:predicted nucleic acid-binding Zn ribbon protein